MQRQHLADCNTAIKLISVLALAIAACRTVPVSAQLAAGREAAMFNADSGAYDPRIPTPVSITGHDMGEGAVRYEPMVRYLRALAEASPQVTLTPYAESHDSNQQPTFGLSKNDIGAIGLCL